MICAQTRAYVFGVPFIYMLRCTYLLLWVILISMFSSSKVLFFVIVFWKFGSSCFTKQYYSCIYLLRSFNIVCVFITQMSGLLQPSSAQNWLGSQGSSSGLIVKRTMRVDIPVDQYPNFNFVGRLLGPRGNSLKRVEASTECRVLIRGRGSIKDPVKEEMMRGKPGYEHLNEPLHILVEAELPVEIVDARLMQAREILEDLLKPVDESQDFYKKQQLRELAMLNGTLRDEGSQMSGSVSPFHNSLGMKRAKTRG
ncbi:hypothetical protein ACSBR2_028527 [Camellia fascicularis]